MEAVKYCKQLKYGYAQTIAHIDHQDELQHVRGNLQPNRTKKNAHAVKSKFDSSDNNTESNHNKKCLNCHNKGHYAAECQSPFCG